MTALVTVYVANDNSKRQHELELTKAEQGRILEVIKIGNPDKAAENLRFLLDAGLIDTPRVVESVKDWLAKRVVGQGPNLLPTYSPAYDYSSAYKYPTNPSPYRNPSGTYVAPECALGKENCASKSGETSPK